GSDLLVLNFFTVNATAGSSGSDAAYLQDSPGNDSFTARPDATAALDYQSAGHINLTQYATVAVYGRTGSATANPYRRPETANLYGRASTTNNFTAGPVASGNSLLNVASLSSPNHYAVAVVGFATVTATNGSPNDLAQLTDSPGDDNFSGTPGFSYLKAANG